MQFPVPPDGIPQVGPIDAVNKIFFSSFIFMLILFILPKKWSDAIIQIAFPFLPSKKDAFKS